MMSKDEKEIDKVCLALTGIFIRMTIISITLFMVHQENAPKHDVTSFAK